MIIPESLQFILIVTALSVTIVIFINTIITKKWRNLAPGEADSWKLGVFYYNPLDSRLFLPKRSGLGITLNFANPMSIIITGVLVALIAGLASL